jgi:RecJ-like exonuclease
MKCPKCHGKGYIEVYDHIDDGMCYMCKGGGVVDDVEVGASNNDYYDYVILHKGEVVHEFSAWCDEDAAKEANYWQGWFVKPGTHKSEYRLRRKK